MRKACTPVFLLLAVSRVLAQEPTGTIAGAVTDAAGSAREGVQVRITNSATGLVRTVVTSSEGHFTAPALPPGIHVVAAESDGFKRVTREATVEAGATTTVNVTLEVGYVEQTVTVDGATPLLRYDHHQVGGQVTRTQIDHLPLNGRNFLLLANLEPGVIAERLANGRVFTSALGGGLQTIPRNGFARTTVDGGNVTTPGTAGVLLQVSQDAVQEFHISTVNFEASTGTTTNGAINIVTRSGGNAYRGSAFLLYRDHHLAAYPALVRDPLNPDPFFRRHQSGGHVGGPVRRNRLFFFTSFEHHDQTGVVSVNVPRDFATLRGPFPTPYSGKLFSARMDIRLSSRHQALVRHTHDGNRTVTSSMNALPSGWGVRTVRANQSLAAVTSVVSDRIVNDVRLSHMSVSTPEQPTSSQYCAGCFGLDSVRTTVGQGVTAFTFGRSGALSSENRRIQVTDTLTWQARLHLFRFGFDWERVDQAASSSIESNLSSVTLWAPDDVRQRAPQLPVPASFGTPDDILRLPLRNFQLSVGSGWPPQRGFGRSRIFDLYRLFASDTWRLHPRLTLNFGGGWSYEPGALNHDLTKPALLLPILGPNRLKAPPVRAGNVSMGAGFAWMATPDGRTVVRGGAGRYFDPASSSNFQNLMNERHLLSPLGTGRLTFDGGNCRWQDNSLAFTDRPTSVTGAQLLDILPAACGSALASASPGNRDFALLNLDSQKQGTNLYDPSYGTPSALHVSLGVQRELAKGLVVTADFAFKRFFDTYINGIDYNRFLSAAGPVIPRCTTQQSTDVDALCSNGSLFFDTTSGRARYKGLLVRLHKRFAEGAQFQGSYALGSFVGSNGTGTGTTESPGGRVFGFNNDDWLENYGPLPTDVRHGLNLSGFVTLPWHFELGFNASVYSAPPFSAYVANMDFNGDGTVNDLLPGTKVNQFGRGLARNDLVQLVDAYNRRDAGRPTPRGPAPFVELPARYAFNDGFSSLDTRLGRTFGAGRDRMRLLMFVEVFNLLNTANLIQYGSDLTRPLTFGQPGQRVGQLFGSGGARAFQLGGRLAF